MIPHTHPNIDEYFRAKGLDNAIHETVQLEETASRPDGRTLVDLAVVRKELLLAERRLCCITSPLDDLSVVFMGDSTTDDLADPETRKWLTCVSVYNKYLSAQIKQRETASPAVLEWYKLRFHEINTIMVQTRRKETLILEQAPSVSPV